jgi:hypothetical protein
VVQDEPGRIVLSDHDWEAFSAALENPPKPNTALKELMKEFGEQRRERIRSLNVQIQPARSPDLDVEATVARLQTVAPATVTRGADVGPYINIGFRATDIGLVWATVREQLRADEALARCVIACCEGERGWDDYRLLHHFDPSQPLDDVV